MCDCHVDQETGTITHPLFRPAPVQGKPNIQFTRGSVITYRDVKENNSDVIQDDDNGSDRSPCVPQEDIQLGEGELMPTEELVPPEGVPCQFCDKVFISHSTLLKHKNKHHPDVEVPRTQEPVVSSYHKESKFGNISSKEPVIVQNSDGTSVITVPPDFWKDGGDDDDGNDVVLEKTEESDDETIIEGVDDRSELQYSSCDDDNSRNDEEDVISSLHDVMNDFIGDDKECKDTEYSEDETEKTDDDEVEEEKEEESVIGNKRTIKEFELKERNKIRRETK